MIEILVFLRFKQLLAHNMHNLAAGPTFLEDHAFFGDFYKQAEGQYDSLIERIIGLGQEINPNDVQARAVELLKEISFPYKEPFKLLQTAEEQLVLEIDATVEAGKLSQGTIQLLGDIANQAEMNLYKLGQKIKG